MTTTTTTTTFFLNGKLGIVVSAYCILRNETKRNETERNEKGNLRVRMLKSEKSFFRNETHYWAVLAGQGNAKENYSCLKPLLSLS